MTFQIGKFALGGTGILVHSLIFLVLCSGLAGARARSVETACSYERIL
jgi:hypothetical protein